MDNENKRNWTTGEATQLMRIANALEEILRLVKKDQEENKKRWDASDQRDDEYHSEVDNEKN